MYYEPLSSLKTLRPPNAIPTTMKPIIERGAIETIDDLTLNPEDTYCRHNAMIALALIFLGNGLADEAHDLITPLSWSEDTYFGGPTLCPRANDPVVAMASYAHSLLHRREGFAQGEFGMMGYQNANYWPSATRSRGDKCMNNYNGLPYKKVREAVLELSTEFGIEAETWCNQHIVEEGGINNDEYWETRALHKLCASVSKEDNVSKGLKEFAEKAAEVELRVLLKCCLERVGYELEEGSMSTTSDAIHTADTQTVTAKANPAVTSQAVDDDLAQSICNKVSSAHIGGFQSSNAVTLRRVVQLFKPSDADSDVSLSAAAGVACRLLGCPAIKLSSMGDSSGNESLQITVPVTETDSMRSIERLTEKFGSSFYGGGPLASGDAFAFIATCSGDEEQVHYDEFYSFVPCDQADDATLFVDRFHGSRGESPTSVLQWSKGTVHKSM